MLFSEADLRLILDDHIIIKSLPEIPPQNKHILCAESIGQEFPLRSVPLGTPPSLDPSPPPFPSFCLFRTFMSLFLIGLVD